MKPAYGLDSGEIAAILPTTYRHHRGAVHAATVINGEILPVCGARPRHGYKANEATWARMVECGRCLAKARQKGLVK